MTAKKLFLFCFLLLCQMLCAQNDSIVALKEVIVSDVQLKKFSDSQSISILKDSVISKNAASLTSLLNYNSTIYFKENGLGMVSSPSFRGTTAQQTAVIWNGININSQLLGQTDFNTITTRDFNSITIRSGGGSAIYGSSAIGGSIHLNNEMHFNKGFQYDVFFNYGSFNSFGSNEKLGFSNKKLSSQISISRNSSNNDYTYLGTKNQKNENGQFYNTSINSSFGYKINNSNILKWYSQIYDSERHFSGTLASKSKNKYQDFNTRNLLEWQSLFSGFDSQLKVVFLSEKNNFFENYSKQIFKTSKAETFITKYNLGYQLNSKINMEGSVDYSKIKGFGSSIGSNSRNNGSATMLFKHQILKSFGYEWSIRKEITDTFKSPLLFSFGSKFQASKNYNLVLNVSRNYRIPTFNDLYWIGLGNPNLKPESSYQAEIGQRLKLKKIEFSATAYYMDIQDLIQWKPNNSNGNWNPNNIANVTSYGAEFKLGYEKKIGSNTIILNSNYAYTVSEDKKIKQQLIYVPFHKLNAGLAFSHKKISANYQHLFNGYVFTTSDHSTFLKSYQVSNIGIDYDFGKKIICKIGFQAANLWNENYQSVAQRPLPGRNYSIYINFKI